MKRVDRIVDREKVIKGLECCSKGDCADCDNCTYHGMQTDVPCESTLMRDALALLKAQEPVEPIPTADDDWICGVCNNSVVGTTEIDEGGFVPVRFNYCQNCGQAVKWE